METYYLSMSCHVCCLRISKSGTNQSPGSDNLNPENCQRGQLWFTHTAYWKNSDTRTNIASLFLQLPFPLSESSFLIWGEICEGEGCLWEVWQGTGIFPPKTFCVETLGGGVCPCGEGSKVLVEMLVKMREVTGRKGDGWYPLVGALPTLLSGGPASLSLCYHSMGERERRRGHPPGEGTAGQRCGRSCCSAWTCAGWVPRGLTVSQVCLHPQMRPEASAGEGPLPHWAGQVGQTTRPQPTFWVLERWPWMPVERAENFLHQGRWHDSSSLFLFATLTEAGV